MANLRVTWVLPTTRESGKPLAPADIAGVDLELSADGGVNYASLGVKPGTEFVITELEPGEWFVRGKVVDTKGRVSAPLTGSAVIEDATAPGALVALALTVE
jgi:hypothetical protein